MVGKGGAKTGDYRRLQVEETKEPLQILRKVLQAERTVSAKALGWRLLFSMEARVAGTVSRRTERAWQQRSHSGKAYEPQEDFGFYLQVGSTWRAMTTEE